MEDTYQKYRFSAISIKKETAKRFRKFSREVSPSHTETLEAMLNFFHYNELSPNDDLGIKNNRLQKRINAVIAIIKNMEKQQTKPTKAMLDALFSEVSKEQEKEEEMFDFGTPETLTENEELEQYRERYEKISQAHHRLKMDMKELLEKVVPVKGAFGNGYLKLEMDQKEFGELKKGIENVHHDNHTEG